MVFNRVLAWHVAIAAMSLCSVAAGADEWTRFRGPNGSGVSNATSIPTEFSPADWNWRVELPGSGHSCPVFWGDKIFLTSADDEDALRYVLCLSTEDGRTLWSRKYASTAHVKHQFNSFATPTPAVDAERVYVVWSSPEEYSVRALSHDGQEVWHRSLGPYVSQHSCGTSPVVYQDKLILGNDQDGVSFLIALDARSGEVVWQSPRTSREVAYSTPCVYQGPDGRDQLIFNSGAHGMTAIDPNTGERIWELAGMLDKRSCSSPVLAGRWILATCGSGGGGNYLVAVDPDRADSTAQPKQVYKISKSAPYVPTPVYADGHIYLWSDQGVVSCVQADTGDILWQNRVGGRFFGSPIWVAGRLFAMSDAGDLVVVAARDQFELLARNAIEEGSHSTPAVADGVLYLRTFSHLISVGGKRSKAS